MSASGIDDLPKRLREITRMERAACAAALSALPGVKAPPRLRAETLRRLLAYEVQARALGGLTAQEFEREVTAERIRDKIAASKKKGLWMGGNVPLGYEAVERTLRIVPAESKTVQTHFELYEQLGTVTAVTAEAAKFGLRSKTRTGRDGSQRGGSVMGRGQVHHVLSNPVNAGRIRHKTQVHEGRHDAIIGPARFDAIQVRLMDKSAKLRSKPVSAHPSPLAGKLFDETGDRLTPSHASKGDKRYRYYVSRKLVAGNDDGNSGNGWRLPADRLERDLARTVKTPLIACIECGKIAARDAKSIMQLRSRVEALGAAIIERIDTVKLGGGTLTVELDPGKIADALSISPDCIAPDALSLRTVFSQRRRGVETRLVIGAPQPARDDNMIASIARAQQWRTALCSGDDLATIATRDGITEKHLGQMLRFAFLSPKLVRAVLEGHQPPTLTTNWLRRHGLPLSWAEQDRIVAQL